MLGLAVFCQQFPSFLLSLFGGIVSDRHNRYKILLITQTASMIQAALMTLLIFSGHYQVWEILGLGMVLGIVNAFDVPARQPMVHDMVNEPADLANALALNAAMVNLARLVGPALSGIILQQFGAGFCFGLNTLSFLAVLTSLLLMKMPAFHPTAEKKKVTAELKEGFHYLKNTPAIAHTILVLTLVSFLVLPYDTLIPVFAKVVFKGDAATFGYISSFMGLGAICGTLFLASLRKGANLKNVLFFNTIALGIGLILFSHTANFYLAMVFAMIACFGAMTQNTVCITMIQIEADQRMRGRMMSYVALSYFGMLPLGSLLIGAVSQRIGAPNAMLIQGIIALVIAVSFFNLFRKDRVTEQTIVPLERAEELVAEPH